MSTVSTSSSTVLVARLRVLLHLLKPGDSSRSILPFIPRPIKYLFLLILLINSRSLPFNWHIRVFRPVVYLRLKWWTLVGRGKPAKDAWLHSLSPVGASPFEKTTVFKTWASPDDADFNMHLSNSSYAKNLDAARLKSALDSFSTFFRDGGWLALGATHYHFIREIPIFAQYEIRVSIASWDNKWMYLVARFVTPPKPGTRAQTQTRQSGSADESALRRALQSPGDLSGGGGVPIPSLHTMATPLDTPLDTPGTQTPQHAPRGHGHAPEADGATLHCIAVSHICFKIGRITVPPALGLASAGFCADADAWARICDVRRRREMRGLLRGGWRDVGEDGKWWEEVMRPAEARRVVNLGVMKGLREGLEGVRGL